MTTSDVCCENGFVYIGVQIRVSDQNTTTVDQRQINDIKNLKIITSVQNNSADDSHSF